MAEWTPPSEAATVGAAAAWTPPPEAKPWTPPAEAVPADAKTTIPGIAAAAARGLAPYAAGAGIGAAAGAPFGGIGAVPGAVAGIGAVGLAELGGGLYNLVAPHIGTPKIVTPQEATDRALDKVGIKRPSTAIERGVEMGAPMVLGGVGSAKGAAELGTMVTERQAAAAGRDIDKLYRSAIKPSTVGTESAAARRAAVNEIVWAKPNLQYVNEAGQVVGSGRVPQTLAEATQALDQAKAQLFREWNGLAAASGQAGGQVDLAPVVQALMKKANDPVLLRDAPGVAANAREMAARYAASGQISPLEAQEAIISWNRRLKGAYGARPDSDTEAVGKAVADTLRKQLDDTITNTVAPGYQELKNRHGALLQIEKDLDRAERRVANYSPGGGILGRMGSTAGIIDAAHGLMSGDLKHVASGLAIKGGTEYLKRLHSPDRSIKKMFELAEKNAPPAPAAGGIAPSASAGQGVIGGIQVPPTGPGMPPNRPGTPAAPGGTTTSAQPPPPPSIANQPPGPLSQMGGAMPAPQPGTPAAPGGYATSAMGLPPRQPFVPTDDPFGFLIVPGGGGGSPR